MKIKPKSKVFGRRDYIVIEAINRLPNPPFKEVLAIRDFTGRRLYYHNNNDNGKEI